MILSDLINKILELILPRKCVGCGNTLKMNVQVFCENCSVLLPRAKNDFNKKKFQKIHYFSDNAAPFYYKSPISNAIQKYKFNKKHSIAGYFANEMYSQIKEQYNSIDFDYIVPIPLTRKDFTKRGFNQAALLAAKLSRLMDIQYNDRLVCKEKQNRKQHTLSKKDRLINIENVYKIVGKESRIAGKKILLIDDILTTGSTLNAVSKLLINAGAVYVYCATIAITKYKS